MTLKELVFVTVEKYYEVWKVKMKMDKASFLKLVIGEIEDMNIDDDIEDIETEITREIDYILTR